MNNKKRFEGILNAPAEKRYKHFVTYVVDEGSAWMLSGEEGFLTFDMEGYINLPVWPSKEFAAAFDNEETPVEIEIHDFCTRCEQIAEEENVRFWVFPNEQDVYVIEPEDLLNDILDELELIE